MDHNIQGRTTINPQTNNFSLHSTTDALQTLAYTYDAANNITAINH